VARALTTLALMFCLACAGMAPPQTSNAIPEVERRAYSDALSRFERDPQQGEAALEKFVRNWPNSPLAAAASVRLGDAAVQRRDQDDALRRFYYVIRVFPRGEWVDAARLRIALVEHDRGNRAVSERMISDTDFEHLSGPDRTRASRLRADSARRPRERMRWLVELRRAETDPVERDRVDAEIDETLAAVEDGDLDRILDDFAPDIPAGRAALRLAENALMRGDFAAAKSHLDAASKLPLAPKYAARLALVKERAALGKSGLADVSVPGFDTAAIPVTRGARGEIGVVLPLTGQFAPFGEESLRGVLLAAGVFDAGRPASDRPSVRLLIRDSQGDPQRAANAVRELARERRVSAIVGPLHSSECEAAAAAADSVGIPLLALTGREQVAADRPQAFRVRTMPKDEIHALAEHATRTLGAQRFGILYPRDAYGRGLSRLFWDAVEERGGEIVALASYDPDSTDFGEAIRKLVGYELISPAEKEAIKVREEMLKSARRLPAEEAAALREEARAMLGPGDRPLPPIVDFEALFIPETHEKVVLIAPQLAYNEASGAVLLGTGAWNHPELVSIARHHVEGALFTANFYADSRVGYVRDFSQRYRRTFGTPAEDFAAQAYDAANLVIAGLAAGHTSRSAMRESVLSTSGVAGASGVMTMGADGNARKRPFLLRVKRGKIVQLD
jgi:ABC-type branched-subunit amino acid transport system substrate-binding protein